MVNSASGCIEIGMRKLDHKLNIGYRKYCEFSFEERLRKKVRSDRYINNSYLNS